MKQNSVSVHFLQWPWLWPLIFWLYYCCTFCRRYSIHCFFYIASFSFCYFCFSPWDAMLSVDYAVTRYICPSICLLKPAKFVVEILSASRSRIILVNKQSELMIITKFRWLRLSYPISSDVVLHSETLQVLTLCSFYFTDKQVLKSWITPTCQIVTERENIALTLRAILRI